MLLSPSLTVSTYGRRTGRPVLTSLTDFFRIDRFPIYGGSPKNTACVGFYRRSLREILPVVTPSDHASQNFCCSNLYTKIEALLFAAIHSFQGYYIEKLSQKLHDTLPGVTILLKSRDRAERMRSRYQNEKLS